MKGAIGGAFFYIYLVISLVLLQTVFGVYIPEWMYFFFLYPVWFLIYQIPSLYKYLYIGAFLSLLNNMLMGSILGLAFGTVKNKLK